jgi:TolB protein
MFALVPGAGLLVLAIAVPSGARVAAGSASGSRPRNGSIVYANQRVANQVNWLYVMGPNGAGQHPLGGVRDVSAPARSPGSRWLLFSKGGVNCAPGGAALYLMHADGSGLRRLTQDRKCYAEPSWAPDGKRIAYASWGRDQLPTIWVMRRDGTARRKLTSPGEGGTDMPAWSPDGHTIAFRAGFPEVIWLMDADGGNQRQLTRFRGLGGGDGDPSWSPNGEWIAFERTHSLSGVWHTDIYAIRSGGSGLRQLTDRRGYVNRMPDWSPDGTRIVFVSDRQRRDEIGDIYVMNADGTHQKPLTRSGIDNQWPAWQARR